MIKRKGLELFIGMGIIFGFGLGITRCVAVPPLPWKLCFELTALMTFFYTVLTVINIRRLEELEYRETLRKLDKG